MKHLTKSERDLLPILFAVLIVVAIIIVTQIAEPMAPRLMRETPVVEIQQK